MELLVGIDAHLRTHTAAALDDQGREIATLRVGADEAAIARLVGWIDGLQNVRPVAVEGANGFGIAVTRRLLAAGLSVVGVASSLTGEGRRRGRRRGKDDEIDAVAVARVALREPDLPSVTAALLDADLKLLVDAREQLVKEAARVRNRLHATLLALAPGHHARTGALLSGPALARARRAVIRARGSDPVRARLALRAIVRLTAIEREACELPGGDHLCRHDDGLRASAGHPRCRSFWWPPSSWVRLATFTDTLTLRPSPPTLGLHRCPPLPAKGIAIDSPWAATAS